MGSMNTYMPTEAQVEAAARAIARYIEGGGDKGEAKWFQYAAAARKGLIAAHGA